MLLPSLLCYSGFTALCLALDRHHHDLLGRKPTAGQRLALCLGGWLLLALSLAAALTAADWGLGLVQWCAVLMGSALLLVVLLPYRPRLALGVAGVGLVVSPAVWALI